MHALLYISLPKCFFQPTKISREDYREIYGKSKTSNRKNCVRPLKFVSRTLCSVALVSEQPLYENYATLYSHTNTVISHALSNMSRP